MTLLCAKMLTLAADEHEPSGGGSAARLETVQRERLAHPGTRHAPLREITSP